MKIKAEIIKIDGFLNKNGRIYTSDNLNEIIHSISNKEINIIFGLPEAENVSKYICGRATSIEKLDDKLIVSGTIDEETYGGKLLSDIHESGLCMYLTPYGTGIVTDNNTIDDYELIGLSIVDSPAFDIKPIKYLETSSNED